MPGFWAIGPSGAHILEEDIARIRAVLKRTRRGRTETTRHRCQDLELDRTLTGVAQRKTDQPVPDEFGGFATCSWT
jgi:hypothetical protein